MTVSRTKTVPKSERYDAVIVGGAMFGSSVAFFLQQSPAMGRGTAALNTYGAYRSLDLSPFNYDRIAENRPFIEKAVI